MSESPQARQLTARFRRPRLLVATAAALALEVFLYRSYLEGDGSFHWFTHFFAGASVALGIVTLAALRRGRPVPAPLLWPLVGHLVAMGPDLLFVKEVAHRRWMDVFVLHNVSHFLPGRNLTWYVIFLGCLAAHLSVVAQGESMAAPDDGGDRRPARSRIVVAAPGCRATTARRSAIALRSASSQRA